MEIYERDLFDFCQKQYSLREISKDPEVKEILREVLVLAGYRPGKDFTGPDIRVLEGRMTNTLQSEIYEIYLKNNRRFVEIDYNEAYFLQVG